MRKIIWESKKNLKILWKLARKFLGKPEWKFGQISTVTCYADARAWPEICSMLRFLRLILYFNNAGPHWAFVVCDLTRIEQPPYSPDFSPCDFFLFNKFKDLLRGHHLDTIEGIKDEMVCILHAISSDFQKCNDGWKNCVRRCIAAGEDVLKGISVTHVNYVQIKISNGCPGTFLQTS